MEIHLKIIGILLVLLALLHIAFPRYFNWKMEFSTVSLINRQMMYIHCFFIAVILLLMGLLCLSSAQELLTTRLENRIALGLAIFWVLRLYIQFFGYNSKLWKGKSFETTLHIVFAILWAYFSGVFTWVYYYG